MNDRDMRLLNIEVMSDMAFRMIAPCQEIKHSDKHDASLLRLMFTTQRSEMMAVDRPGLDAILREVNENLPQFNRYTLRGYRQEKIAEVPATMDHIFTEAVQRYGCNDAGEPIVKYLGHRFLDPQECLALDVKNPKYSSFVDVLRTEQTPVEFAFEHNGQQFTTQVYVPYICEDALIVNNSRYYVMFALTDKVFYHITKNHGIGIKILCGHLRFWRGSRYSFISTRGHVYGDQLLITKIHMRNYKYIAEDLRTVALLYPLVRFGLRGAIERYGINPDHIQIVKQEDKSDVLHEYFWIPITSNENEKNHNGFYLKVHQDVLKARVDADDAAEGRNRIGLQVVTALNYIFSYFRRYKETIYKDKDKLVEYLTEDPNYTVYKVILGKTIFGINYESEIQAAGHMRDHLQSLEQYIDPETKRKLRTIGVECNDVYDLIYYVSENMDSYVANYFPSNVYNKQMNVLDLLTGDMVIRLFNSIYTQTNNRKGDRPYTTEQIMSSLRVSMKIFSRIYSYPSLIAGNPSVYNDNGLFTVLGRKRRATFTAAKPGNRGDGKRSRNDELNLLSDPEHRTHSSIFIVESGARTQSTDPTKGGTINPFLIVTPNGELIIPEWLKKIAATVDKYIHTK